MSKWSLKAKQNKEIAEARKAGIELPKNTDAAVAKEARSADGEAPWKRRTTLPAAQKTRTVSCIPITQLTFNDIKRDKRVSSMNNETGKPPSKLMKITNPTNLPLIVKFTGGGNFPEAIGVKKTARGYNVNVTVNQEQERKSLNKICDEFLAFVLTEAEKYYPPGTAILRESIVRRWFSEPRAKVKGGNDFYESLLNTKIKEEDLEQPDPRVEPELIIMNEEGQRITIPSHLLGLKWIELRIELQFILFGWQEIAETKETPKQILPQVMFTSRLLGKQQVAIDPEKNHLVYPHEQAVHDATPCQRRHDFVTHISQLKLSDTEQYIKHSLVPSKMTSNARIQRKDGSTVYMMFNGGGSLPPFAVGENLNNQITLTFTLENEDEVKACDEFSRMTVEEMVLPWRASFFPECQKSDEIAADFVKPFLPTGTEKSRLKGYNRSKHVIFEPSRNGTSLMIVDENDVLVTEPEELANRRWDIIWIAVYGLYVNSKGSGKYESDYSLRLKYLKLAPKKEHFVVAD